MDRTRTPKRKRRSGRKAAAASSSASRTPGSGGSESKIVWKDSPADKQIKVSGTGKMAVRREMQGFVGRLARASQQSPPSSSDEERKSGRERARSRRKTTQEEKGVATSRHLMFSPPDRPLTSSTAGKRRRSTERGDSQDELFSVLDQMEQKYASPDVTGTLMGNAARKRPLPPPAAAVAAAAAFSQDASLASIVAPSYSSTGTLSPPSSRSQDGIRTQEEVKMQELPKTLTAIKEQAEQKSPVKSVVVEADPFDDLTDESWALLDQLQSQRAPVESSQAQSQSQTELVSSQSFALTPRPMPSAASDEPKKSPSMLPPAPVSVVRPMHGPESGQQLNSPESFRRFLVLEVDRDVVNRSLLLRLLDDQDVQLEAVLIEDWYDVLVEAGDTINIVFTEQDRNGFFSQDEHCGSVVRRSSRIQVDNAHNVVVVHPDILVSPTRVTTSFGCLRRAVLQETLAVSRPTGEKALLGTLKHDLFEHAVLNSICSAEALRHEAKRIVNSNILGLVECGLNEENALLELGKVIEDYRSWVSGSIAGSGVPLNELPPRSGSKLRVSRVLATEEMMWSIKWGLKGATDASVEGALVDPGGGNNTASGVLPLELKTGSKKYAGVEHQGQVILYTLLLSERYRQRCQEGLLIYVPPIETNRIAAMATHVRGLIMARNNFASAIAKVKAIGGSTSAQVFPPMIRNRRDCERCFQKDECILHHAATENGTGESSGLGELFTLMTKHLGEADLTYFRQWNRLIDLEQQHAEKNLRALWLQVGWKRELAQESSTCIAHLKLVSDTPAASESGAKRTLRFVRDRRRRTDAQADGGGTSEVSSQPTSFAGVRFRVDERVILSAESLDGKNLLVHVSRATVRKIEHGLITIEARQSIPTIVTGGQSAVGKHYTWRLDKDAIMSGLRRARENLVQLFIGTPPEVVSAGTALTGRPELQVRMASAVALGSSGDRSDNTPGTGDTRRRNLVVHLARPHFKPCQVTELVTQRCQDCAKDDHDGTIAALGQSLLNAFFELNIDQQRAVQRVLSSLDYALVLGMPGTGKTATIVFTVRVLMFLGFSVLVTSYTHSAVDNLLLKLLAWKLPMLRIGNTAQVHPLIEDFTLDRQAEREGISSVRAMEAKMINAQLVGCTCLSVNSHVLFSKRRFDFCIVDEATQITQPIVLSALRSADTFVLVGDHYQLPPLVANAQARKEGMDVSLFRRLAEAHPEATQQLSYQYRMNRDIMLLANRLVYGDKLKCGSFSVASNYLQLRWQRQNQGLIWPAQVLSNNQGVMFLDTDTMGEATVESSSSAQMGNNGRRRMENVVEAQIVAGLVELLVLGSVPADQIAVISPFRSQVALIQQHLTSVAAFRRAGGSEWVHSVEVSTIDKYQGKDKDVILVSFVRCNEEKHVGELLTDWRRINVALTRAKQKLLLVGSQSTLSGGSALFNVLASVIQNNKWGYKLPQNAVDTLRQFAVSVAAPVEPDPEQGTASSGSRMSRAANNVKVSILQRSAPGSNGDIESLVSNVSSVPFLPRQGSRPPQMKPISRDIFGQM